MPPCQHPSHQQQQQQPQPGQNGQQGQPQNSTQSGQSNNTGQTIMPGQSQVGPHPLPPIANNDCTGEGFVGDRTNCSKFYRCVSNGQYGYIKYPFSCGPGTVWDQFTLACNYPWATAGHCGENGLS